MKRFMRTTLVFFFKGHLIGLVLFCFISVNATMAPDQLAFLKHYMDGIKTFEAHFVQTTESTAKVLSQKNKSKGRLFIKKPLLLRYVVTEPFYQLYVARGPRLIAYDASLKQMIIRKVDTSTYIPALIFNGEWDLLQKNYRFFTEHSGLTSLFGFIPKSKEASFDKFELVFQKKVLHRIKIYSALGSTTTIVFSKIKLNGAIADHLFRFEPPKETDILDETGVSN